MSGGVKLLLYFIGSVVISACFAPLVIKLLKRFKAKQTVLGYVSQHEHKTGTPTMGGFIFLLPMIIFSLIEWSPVSIVAMSVTLGFGIIGFLDDFIKIKFSRNLGLKAYQKIIGQLGLCAIAGYFCFASPAIGTRISLPLTDVTANLGWGIIPFTMLVYVATTNSVNLTDGLDGLAGYTSVGYFLTFTMLIFFMYLDADKAGDAMMSKELFSLAAFAVAMLGGLGGYLLFNSNPASVMMGDTGSLALGAAAATVASFSANPIYIVTAGIMFVWSSISVILQVLYFKAKGKRIFLMAPFHHHLEMKGMSETKVATLYFVITLVAGAITLIFARAV